MGGMDNETSIELSRAKNNSRKFHSKRDEKLYEEYLNSSAQYTITFLEWKQSKKKRMKKGKMQKPLTPKQLEERGYNTKLSLNYVRWK